MISKQTGSIGDKNSVTDTEGEFINAVDTESKFDRVVEIDVAVPPKNLERIREGLPT